MAFGAKGDPQKKREARGRGRGRCGKEQYRRAL